MSNSVKLGLLGKRVEKAGGSKADAGVEAPCDGTALSLEFLSFCLPLPAFCQTIFKEAG